MALIRNGAAIAAAVVLASLTALWWFLPRPVPAADRAIASAGDALSVQAKPMVRQPATRLFVPPPLHGPDEVQGCGGAWLRLNAERQLTYEQLVPVLHVEDAGDRLEAALHADPNPRAQAVALYLDGLVAAEQRKAQTPCSGEDCASRPVDGVAPNPADALAREAATSTDPAVYGLALRSCGLRRASTVAGPCAALSIAQWAYLDPGNAAPWAYALGAAREQHDEAAAEAALYRIATASRYDSGRGALAQIVAEHFDDSEESLPANWLMMIVISGIQAAWVSPPYQSLLVMCEGDALNDANRRQVCEGAAKTLLERADDLLTQGMGIAIGDRLGWPVDDIDRMRGARELFWRTRFEHQPEADLGGGMGASCADMRRELQRFRDVAALGEAGTVRAWLASSPEAPAESLAFGRKLRAARLASEAAAASRSAASNAGPH